MASLQSHALISNCYTYCAPSNQNNCKPKLSCLFNSSIPSTSSKSFLNHFQGKSKFPTAFQIPSPSASKFVTILASSSKAAAELEPSGENSSAATELLSEKQTDSKDDTVDVKDRRNHFWKKARQMAQSGNAFECKVEAANSGGLILFFGVLRCFLPFSQIDPSRLQSDKSINEIAEGLIGKTISCKFIDLNESEGRIILSEKAANVQKRMEEIKEGGIYDGKISSITDFGLFVDIQLPDGSFPLTGLIHVSEISWDPVKDFQNLFQVNKKVKVKVIRVDKIRERISLSIKQLKNDPLYETLDNILFLDDNDATGSLINVDFAMDEETENLLKSPLPGLVNICQELMNENGILEVTVGRKGLERKVVSQDLELWLSNAVGEDGAYTILARAGRQVQEIYVQAKLDRQEMINSLKIVTSRVV